MGYIFPHFDGGEHKKMLTKKTPPSFWLLEKAWHFFTLVFFVGCWLVPSIVSNCPLFIIYCYICDYMCTSNHTKQKQVWIPNKFQMNFLKLTVHSWKVRWERDKRKDPFSCSLAYLFKWTVRFIGRVSTSTTNQAELGWNMDSWLLNWWASFDSWEGHERRRQPKGQVFKKLLVVQSFTNN